MAFRNLAVTTFRSHRVIPSDPDTIATAAALLAADGLLTVRHICALRQCAPSTVWESVRAGKLGQPQRLGARCTRWRAQAVRKFLEGAAP
jgi:predicted DNA-binding transcriptional regulator AlpA